MTTPSFAQGSPEWLEWRRGGIGGSDAPIIMGVSPYATPLELWRRKCGLEAEQPSNSAMSRGSEMEAVARIAYRMQTGLAPTPMLVVHPEHEWLRASLDGYDAASSLPLEIKCPGRSDHNEAKEGRVPDKYYPQVQHILMVTGAAGMHYWSFDGDDGVLVPVEADAAYQAELFEKERAFWWNVTTRTSPEAPTYTGIVEIGEPSLIALADQYRLLSEITDRHVREQEKLKAKLLAICTGAVNKIGPVTITRVSGRMTLDQKALAASGVDVAPYRKRGADYWKLEVKETA